MKPPINVNQKQIKGNPILSPNLNRYGVIESNIIKIYNFSDDKFLSEISLPQGVIHENIQFSSDGLSLWYFVQGDISQEKFTVYKTIIETQSAQVILENPDRIIQIVLSSSQAYIGIVKPAEHQAYTLAIYKVGTLEFIYLKKHQWLNRVWFAADESEIYISSHRMEVVDLKSSKITTKELFPNSDPYNLFATTGNLLAYARSLSPINPEISIINSRQTRELNSTSSMSVLCKIQSKIYWNYSYLQFIPNTLQLLIFCHQETHYDLVLLNLSEPKKEIVLQNCPIDAIGMHRISLHRWAINFFCTNNSVALATKDAIYYWKFPMRKEKLQKLLFHNKNNVLYPQRILTLAQTVTREFIKQQNRRDNEYIACGLDWIMTAGRLAKYTVREESWPGKPMLGKKISVGKDIPSIVDVSQNGIVSFPDRQDSYPQITQKLQTILPRRQYDFLSMAEQIQNGEFNYRDYLDVTHAHLAKILLQRIHKGDAYPTRFLPHKQFLDTLLFLIVAVEGSRNNTTFLTVLLHLDLIATSQVYGEQRHAYTFTNAFMPGYAYKWDDWERLEKERQRKDYTYGGKFSMATHGTGSKNLTDRRDELKQDSTGKKFIDQPQHHRVPSQEMKTISRWLNALAPEYKALLNNANNAAQLEQVIKDIFIKRLKAGYDSSFPVTPFLTANEHGFTVEYCPVLHDQRDESLVYVLKHINKSPVQAIQYGKEFHRIDQPCKLVTEYTINQQEKNIAYLNAAIISEFVAVHRNKVAIKRKIKFHNMQMGSNNIKIDFPTISYSTEQGWQVVPIHLQNLIWKVVKGLMIDQLRYLNVDFFYKILDEYYPKFYKKCYEAKIIKIITKKDFIENTGAILSNIWQITDHAAESYAMASLENIKKLLSRTINEEKICDIWANILIKLLQSFLCRSADKKIKRSYPDLFCYAPEEFYAILENKCKEFNFALTIQKLEEAKADEKVVLISYRAICNQPGLPQSFPLVELIKIFQGFQEFTVQYSVKHENSAEFCPCTYCYGYYSPPSPQLPLVHDYLPVYVDQGNKVFHRLDFTCGFVALASQKIVSTRMARKHNFTPCPCCWVINRKIDAVPQHDVKETVSMETRCLDENITTFDDAIKMAGLLREETTLSEEENLAGSPPELPLYTDSEITTLLNVKLREIGGYAPNKNFLLSGIGEGEFPDEDNFRYLVLLTPAIDIASHAAPIDFYLDKYKQQAPDSGREDHRKDVFDELNVYFPREQSAIKIIFPYNITNIHWLTGEIKIIKKLHHYNITITAHDPYGNGTMEDNNFKSLAEVLKRKILQYDSDASFNIGNQNSQFTQRQHARDYTSCGVIIIEDIMRRITGKNLFLETPYPAGAVKLREENLHLISRSPDVDPVTKRNFIKKHAASLNQYSTCLSDSSPKAADDYTVLRNKRRILEDSQSSQKKDMRTEVQLTSDTASSHHQTGSHSRMF